MHYELLMLSDGTCPPGSPFYGLDVSVEREARFDQEWANSKCPPPSRIEVTLERTVLPGETWNLLGTIEPVEWERFLWGSGRAIYKPTRDEWYRLVAVHNEAVRIHAEDH